MGVGEDKNKKGSSVTVKEIFVGVDDGENAAREM